VKPTGEIIRVINGQICVAFKISKKMININSIMSLSPRADLLAIAIQVSEGPNYAMELIDVQHNISENVPLPSVPLTSGVSVISSKFYALSANGIDIIPFTKKAVSLSSAIGKTKSAWTSEVNVQKQTLLDSLTSLSTDGLITELNRLKQLNNGYVPEKILAEIVNHILSNGDLEDSDFDFTFNYLMTLPYNVHFLTSQIRSLNLPLAKVLTLTNKMLQKLETPELQGDVCVNVLDWITAILDANFRQIIVSAKQFAEPLFKLREFVDRLCTSNEGLLNLKSTVELVISSSNHKINTEGRGKALELPILPTPEYSVDVIFV
jgi:hypothetical protein